MNQFFDIMNSKEDISGKPASAPRKKILPSKMPFGAMLEEQKRLLEEIASVGFF